MKQLLFAIILIPSCLFSQTPIYRSVQPGNTSAIATNSIGTMTISGNTATFSAAIPDTVGVGVAIQYDSLNIGANNSIVFVHGRTSSTVFTVERASGLGNPPQTTTNTGWAAFHAYTTLANCEAGTENTGIDVLVRAFDAGNINIDTANEQWNVVCYRGTDTGVTIWTGWTTSATDYLRFYTPYLVSEVGTRQRHLGIWTTNAFRIELNSGGVGTWAIASGSTARHIRIEGLQVWIKAAGSTASGAFSLTATTSSYEVSYCILRGASNGTTNGDFHAGIFGFTGSASVRIWNNIIYDFITPSTANDAGVYVGTASPTPNAYVYNNTIYGCSIGLLDGGATANVVAKNNICDGNTTDFSGTGDSGCEFNASADATAPGTNSRTSQTITYRDEAGDDFHLSASDVGALGFGKDLSADGNIPFSIDIDNQQRPVGIYAKWDIGADEVIPDPSILLLGKRLMIN
jgi:hypothetical protein